MMENEISEESEDYSSESEANDVSEPIEIVTPLSFDDWFEESIFSDTPQVLENVNEWTVEEIVQHYAEEFALEDEWYSFAYTNLLNDETYTHREDDQLIAASTTKVLHAMVYYDLLEKEEITLDSPIPYAPLHYQAGGGKITGAIEGGWPEEYYPLEYVIQELIVRSDNSAWLMLIDYYNQNYGSIYEAMSELLPETHYPIELLYENETTAAYLEEMLLTLLEKELYEPILEYMRAADEDLFLLYYVDNHHPVKYGLLFDLKHHVGIYEVEEQPIATLVVLTNYLNYDQANEFMGGIGLQLAVKGEYEYYLASMEE